jgi:hypothetical protein
MFVYSTLGTEENTLNGLRLGQESNRFWKWQRTDAIPNSVPDSVMFIKQNKNIILLACILNDHEVFLNKCLTYKNILFVWRIDYEKDRLVAPEILSAYSAANLLCV